MIYGIGVDIIKISRIKLDDSFIKRILNDQELEELKKINKSKIKNFVASRFSAKESFSKALGTGIGEIVSFKDITIVKDELGKPYFHLSSKLKNHLQNLIGNDKHIKCHLSLSDCTDYANTLVIIEII